MVDLVLELDLYPYRDFVSGLDGFRLIFYLYRLYCFSADSVESVSQGAMCGEITRKNTQTEEHTSVKNVGGVSMKKLDSGSTNVGLHVKVENQVWNNGVLSRDLFLRSHQGRGCFHVISAVAHFHQEVILILT